MFLAPKLFDFNVYQSLQWTVRTPVQDFQSTQRVNLRYLPTIPISKMPQVVSSTRFHANHLLLQSLPTSSTKYSKLRPIKNGFEVTSNKPRTITIIKYGAEKPYRKISILLNRRTIQTFEQLLSDVSEAFGCSKNRYDRIKRLYTIKGRQVNGIHEFFRDEEIFIGTTSYNEISVNDFQEIQNDQTLRRNVGKLENRTGSSDIETSVTSVPPITVDVKKTRNNRDSEVVEGEDETFSGKDSDAASVPKIFNRNSYMKFSDFHSDQAASKKMIKLAPLVPHELQREIDRQRYREENERRKRLAAKKEQLTAGILPKFVPLTIDSSNQFVSPSKNLNKTVNSSHQLNQEENLAKLTVKKRSPIMHPSPAAVTDKYEFGKKMGDGNFALVCRSKSRENQREFAIKIIDKSKMKGKEHMLDNEINVMYMCNHTNIVRLYEDYETSENIYLVMELIKGGDLFDHISKHRRFDEATSAIMIKDVGEALLYLHSKNIVHRDLKPENLLVMQRRDGRIQIKLTDFGLAMVVTGTIKTVCGTPTYVAPEILADTGYGLEVDCWAVGVILYILLCGYPPFKASDRNQDALFQLIQQGKYAYEPESWASISANAKDLIDHLLVVDRHKRITPVDILVHPWILTMGQSKSIRYIDELKRTVRSKCELKMKEYAKEMSSLTNR